MSSGWCTLQLEGGFLLSWCGSSIVKKKEKRLGKLLHYACSGPYGGREIGEFSITMKV